MYGGCSKGEAGIWQRRPGFSPSLVCYSRWKNLRCDSFVSSYLRIPIGFYSTNTPYAFFHLSTTLGSREIEICRWEGHNFQPLKEVQCLKKKKKKKKEKKKKMKKKKKKKKWVHYKNVGTCYCLVWLGKVSTFRRDTFRTSSVYEISTAILQSWIQICRSLQNTLFIYKSIRCHISQDINGYIYRRENFESHMSMSNVIPPQMYLLANWHSHKKTWLLNLFKIYHVAGCGGMAFDIDMWHSKFSRR